MIDNEAFRKALDFLKESGKYGPPDELNMDVSDTRPLFVSGKCALNLDWGDVGVLAIDPKISKVIDKTGSVITPGSKEVLNWSTGKLEACTKDTCPYAIDGVNHAPYAAFGGWSGGINAKAKDKVKDAAYAFLSYMSQPAQSNVDVTIGKTGFNPYRISQFTYNDVWKNAGMSKVAGDSYLGAIKDSLDSPNMILDLRIPQNQKYQQVVLDEAIARFLAGEIDKEADGQGGLERLERSQRADRRREPAQVLQGHARHPALSGATTLLPGASRRAGKPASDSNRIVSETSATPRAWKRVKTNGRSSAQRRPRVAARETRDEWIDRNSGRIMVLPAVIILLCFAIFPLIVSVYLSLCRFALAGGSFTLTFIGLYNYKRLLFGAQQYHLPRHAEAA